MELVYSQAMGYLSGDGEKRFVGNLDRLLAMWLAVDPLFKAALTRTGIVGTVETPRLVEKLADVADLPPIVPATCLANLRMPQLRAIFSLRRATFQHEIEILYEGSSLCEGAHAIIRLFCR